MNGTTKATANAGSNIAFVKYWGIRRDRPEDPTPLNTSVSMTLEAARTTTTVEFSEDYQGDTCTINGRGAPPEAAERVQRVLARVRRLAGNQHYARVESVNHFPTSVGLASSASGFAALALAAAEAAGLPGTPETLVPLATLGSGSACRSLHGGYVLWAPPEDDPQTDSSVLQLAREDDWDLVDLVAIVSKRKKSVSSLQGHLLAWTSPLLEGRISSMGELVPRVKKAIQDQDLLALGEAMEADALCMHAVMMTSRPPLLYWEPPTVGLLKRVAELRIQHGLPCYFTIDAGPNVHVITLPERAEEVAAGMRAAEGVKEILRCPVGRGPYLSEDHLF
jgi:diphosphomevalonate decarboxylase